MESTEFRKQSLKERLEARMDYIFRPTGPISKEVTRQITKIQNNIPYGTAWEAFEKAKHQAPANLAAVDADFKSQSKWGAATNIVNLWFHAPIFVMLMWASPASRERKKIRKTAKEWKKHLTGSQEGKQMIGSKNPEILKKRVDEIVKNIIGGIAPEHA